MNIAVLANIFRDPKLEITREIIGVFKRRGVNISVEASVCAEFPGYPVFDRRDLSNLKSDFIVTVGGDGTILDIIAEAAAAGIPILGINSGKVGFLAELERGELSEYLGRLLAKDYQTDKRSMLELEITRDGEIFRHIALNEFVFNRATSAKMVNLDVCADTELLDTYNADGFIISTPTGSTAYCLSAGGPVLEPDINGFALVPINAHSLHSRPLVVRDGISVGIKILDDRASTLAVADGKIIRDDLGAGDRIFVKKASVSALFVRLKQQNFYARLKNKLSKW